MNSTFARTALSVVATAAVAGTLMSCSSSGEEPTASMSAREYDPPSSAAQAPATGPTEPASSADEAGMRAVFERYVETSNAGQAQPYLETICSTDPVHQQDLQDREPALYPMSVQDMRDFTAEGDDGLATVVVKIGLEDQADVLTERFTFVREDGAWTVCGKQPN